MIRRNISWFAAMATAVLASLLFGAPGFAAAPTPAPAPVTLAGVVSNITTWMMGLLFGVATLYLTIGGIRYLTAAGDPTELDKGKSALKSALIGYALAILAPVLLAVVQGWIGG